MLILTRHEQQRVLIETPSGENIWITVIKLERGKVGLGFEASQEISINREEVLPAYKQHPNTVRKLGEDYANESKAEG